MIFSLSSKFTHKLSVVYGEKRNENLLDVAIPLPPPPPPPW